MPLLKLNRINKGGSIIINTDYIQFIEVESRVTTVHMADRLLFSVEETMEWIVEFAEKAARDRLRDAMQPGDADKPAA